MATSPSSGTSLHGPAMVTWYESCSSLAYNPEVVALAPVACSSHLRGQSYSHHFESKRIGLLICHQSGDSKLCSGEKWQLHMFASIPTEILCYVVTNKMFCRPPWQCSIGKCIGTLKLPGGSSAGRGRKMKSYGRCWVPRRPCKEIARCSTPILSLIVVTGDLWSSIFSPYLRRAWESPTAAREVSCRRLDRIPRTHSLFSKSL